MAEEIQIKRQEYVLLLMPVMPAEEIIDRCCHDHSYVIHPPRTTAHWWAPNSRSSNPDVRPFAK